LAKKQTAFVIIVFFVGVWLTEVPWTGSKRLGMEAARLARCSGLVVQRLVRLARQVMD
jgi:hypothetical protein